MALGVVRLSLCRVSVSPWSSVRHLSRPAPKAGQLPATLNSLIHDFQALQRLSSSRPPCDYRVSLRCVSTSKSEAAAGSKAGGGGVQPGAASAAATKAAAADKDQDLKAIVKAVHDTEQSEEQQFFDRNFITAVRAMQEFLLKPEHLVGLRVTTRRSAKDNSDPAINVYWRKDIEAASMALWGSQQALEAEKEKREKQALAHNLYKRFIMRERRKGLTRSSWPVRGLRSKEEGLQSNSGRVILAAVGINTANFFLKLVAWIFTGSHAMFSEAIHSAADTVNQIILAYGLQSSAKKADEEHPYGYTNMQYVSSLISGVGIFCMGAGLSVYHGVEGLLHPQTLESLPIAIGVLTVSFVSESATLALAIKSIRESATQANMSFFEYVVGGFDPCVNVVLLEDTAAVLGVVFAASAMGLSVYTGSHVPDALGSIAIGGLLGGVATFMIITNTNALVGKSIPEEKMNLINSKLEGDIMVRQIHDVKGIDMGNGIIRYKAEVDVDGRALAQYYLSKRNLDLMMAEIQAVKTKPEMEAFMLKHGENVVDCLGEQVDRIEKELKKNHPEVRHVDLEVL